MSFSGREAQVKNQTKEKIKLNSGQLSASEEPIKYVALSFLFKRLLNLFLLWSLLNAAYIYISISKETT